MSFLRRSKL